MPITGPGPSLASAAGQYALELDGAIVGWLASVEGGYASAEVVQAAGPGQVVHKHLGNVKYEDITLTCGLAMAPGFYDWLQGVIKHTPQPKNGAVIALDYNLRETSRLEFSGGLVSDIQIPKCDGASKDAAYFTIKFALEYTRYKQGSGQPVSGPGLPQPSRPNWLCSNFRLLIDGLDCTHVNRIDAIVIRQHILEYLVGQTRSPEKRPTYVELPNLAVTLAQSSAASWYDWYEDFIIKGHNEGGKEKNGTLEFLAPDLRQVLLTLTFKGLGIFTLYPEKVQAGSDKIPQVTAEMYCNEIGFSPSAAVSWQPSRIQREPLPPPFSPAVISVPAPVSRLGPAFRFRA